MPRREECVFCGGTHGPRPTSHFAGGDAHIAPPPLARHRRAARLPLGGGCRRSRLGERKRRLLPLPLSALRAATSLAEGGNGLPRRFAPRNDSASLRRGRRPAVERSGTNALGVRRPVCRGGRLCPPCTLRSSRRSEALQHKKRTARGRFFFCLFRADRSGIRCRYQSRPGCSNSLSASQTQPRSHLPAD